MENKSRPESKISPEKNNPPKKGNSVGQHSDTKLETSLLKKNEFTLIIFGALLLTIIIFFLFFRSSGSEKVSGDRMTPGTSFAELEQRIDRIEKALQTQEAEGPSGPDNREKEALVVGPLTDRVTRLETAFSVKFDSLIERMEKMENSISRLQVEPAAILTKKVSPSPSIPPVKKAIKKPSVFHAVQKGETLYSISKKYNTSVTTLRKLNNLSDTAKIYPGTNILVR